MIAGFALGLSEGLSLEETLQRASAISAAAAMREETGFFVMEDMEALLPKIQIKNSHTIACCLKIDSQCCKLFQTFLPCLDIIHKALQRSGTDHNGVF